MSAQDPHGKIREGFEMWAMENEHPVFGWIGEGWLDHGDDPNTYANDYIQGAWVVWQRLHGEQQWPKLEKRAQVRGTIFGVGVSSHLVIGAAQRFYEYSQQPEVEAERLAKLRGFIDAVTGPTMEERGPDDLNAWFGLTYASWAVLPRVMMQAMPNAWQASMAKLLREWDKEWDSCTMPEASVQAKSGGRFTRWPAWLLNYRHPDREQLQLLRRKKP